MGILAPSAGRLSEGIRLAAVAEETQRLERALAVARLGLAALLLAVELFQAGLRTRGAALSVVLLAAYAAQSLLLLAFLRRHDSTPALRRLIHGLDVLWTGLLSLAGYEVFTLLSVLVIYAAASRWGLPQALVTAGAVCGLLLLKEVLDRDLLPSAALESFDGRRFLLRAAALLVLAFLFGYMTRREKELQAETTQAKAMDRALVARELHDGAIQSLIGMEVQVDALRRQAAAESPALAEELLRIRYLLRQEVLNLRELMQQMKPLDLDPRQLLDFLAEAIDKFRRETGISASFVSELREISLSPRICTELARIAQEALVNVRKHSGANNVILRLSLENGAGRLVVDDDGRGFDFSGRLSQTELDTARKGPVIIKERVRAIGGRLSIESAPGRGARLEITFPHE
jgi:signal transduction histidine kinase